MDFLANGKRSEDSHDLTRPLGQIVMRISCSAPPTRTNSQLGIAQRGRRH